MNEKNFKEFSFTIVSIQSEHWSKFRGIFTFLSERTTESLEKYN
jgi:hypothetical protein